MSAPSSSKLDASRLDQKQLEASTSLSTGAPNTPEHHDSDNEDSKKYSRGTGKRNRVHFACTECYRRKQKCNRETPCQHCIARKIPERCKTFQPAEENNDVSSRLSRVERLLEDYLPRLMQHVDRLSSSSSTPASLAASNSKIPRNSKSAWTDESFSTSPAHIQDESKHARGDPSKLANDSDEDEMDELEPDGRLSPKTGFYDGGSMDMRISSILDGIPGSSTKTQPLNAPIRIVEGVPDLDDVMAEYGCPSGPTPDLLSALHSRNHCNILLDHFFDRINWMRQPLPQKSLRQSFENFWNSGPVINAQNINIFALLCNLCAISTLSVEHALFPQEPRERLKVARRYHYAGRRALLMSSIMGREDVDQVVAWTSSCRFLLLDRRIGEAYTLGSSAVRAAFSIGLHRDGAKLGLSPTETEARRRVWAAVYFLDRALALNTGRPAVIDDRCVDTELPSSVMDEDVFPVPERPPKMPEGVEPPTAFSYTVYRQRIAYLEGRILNTFQNLRHPVHISDVLSLDQSIRELQDGLPFYFRARLTKDGVECDKSLDPTYGFLNVHRFLLHTEINSVRIALHRPYLLRSGGAHGMKFMPCREASLDAALHDLELRKDFVADLKASMPDNVGLLLYRVQIGTYKWFHSLLVCGIILLMDPWAPNADRLKKYLEHYVEVYQKKMPHERDEMRDREANVIGLFLSKLEQVRKMGPASKNSGARGVSRVPKRGRSMDVAAGDANRDAKSSKRDENHGNSDEKSDAHLLLGLGQQQSPTSGGHVPSPSSRSSLTYSGLSGSTRSPRQSIGGHVTASTAARPVRASHSGDWPRGYPSSAGIQASPSGTMSSSNSPTASSTAVGLSNISAGDTHTTASSTPPVSASNNGGDDAQQIFDAWYQAEWAAASMPSFDAAYNGVGGANLGGLAGGMGFSNMGSYGGMPGGGAGIAANGLGGGFNGLGGLSMTGFSNQTAGNYTGWNAQTTGGATGESHVAPVTSAGAAFAPLVSSPTSQALANSQMLQQEQQKHLSGLSATSGINGGPLDARQKASNVIPSRSGANEGSPSKSGWHSGFPKSKTEGLNSTSNQTHSTAEAYAGINAAIAPVNPGSVNPNFDPAFWQSLIDKIIT